MTFAYSAFDKSGKALTGNVDAASVAEATEALRRQGLFVSRVSEGKQGAVTSPAPAAPGSAAPTPVSRKVLRRGLRLRFLAGFARQMNVLVSSGTPVAQGLSAIERQCENSVWRGVLADLRNRLQEGTALSEAMAAHPEYFDSVCRSLMAAGEASGSMPQMLERLAVLTNKQVHLRSTIVGAMIYPCVLVAIGFCVLILMLMFVLPRFAGLFETLDVPLPASTQFLMWLSGMLQKYWWGALAAVVLLVVAGRSWLASASGKETLHTLSLKLPKLERVTRSLMTAKIARLLGVLLECKVPLLEALKLTRAAAVNVHYVALLERTEELVSKGEPMSAGFETDLIVPAVQEAIRNGEQSGQLGAPLVQMADFLDEENQIIVKSLTGLMEPLILILLGAVVGLIAMSMFLPLFDLTAMAGGGG